MGLTPEVTLYVSIGISVIALYARLKIISPLVNLNVFDFFKTVIMRIIPVVIVSFILPFLVFLSLEESFLKLLLTVMTSILSALITIYYIGLGKAEQEFMNRKLKQFTLKVKA